MHEFNAARIFWKEWRAQRLFWMGLFALALGLEVLLVFGTPFLRRNANPIDQLRMYQSLVIVLACSFATGSTAIAFAGEVEAKTKGLLQRIPLRPRDLLVGKLSLSLIGSYALMVGLWLVGAFLLLRSTETSFSSRLSSDVSREINSFLRFVPAPLDFVVIGSFFSLLMSDVLLTVLIAGLSTAVLLALPGLGDHLALEAGIIAVVAVCDFFLARRWLCDPGAAELTGWRRLPLPQLAFRPRRELAHVATEPRAKGHSAVAWRRAAGSLIWKEFRQAFPFCLTLLVAGLILLAFVPLTNRANWSRGNGMISILLIAFGPLLPGVAAIRADRRGGAYRLLADHGLAPEGFLISKHFVWLSLSLAVFGILLMVDRTFLADLSFTGRPASLWNFAASTARASFDSPETSNLGPLTVTAFHVVLLYSLGLLLGILVSGAVAAFFGGTLLWLALVMCWILVVSIHLPFWSTMGLFPVIFLAVAWVRSADWLVGRNAPRAWGKVAACLLVPLFGLVAASAVYRVMEIPAVAVPEYVIEAKPASESTHSAAAGGQRSLFVDALSALSGPPPFPAETADGKSISDGWSYATPAQKRWVERNAAARKLALDAAQHPPGYFPLEPASEREVRALRFADAQRTGWLCHLLLDSARQLESQDRLDEALSCYVGVVRLGSDAAKSERPAPMMVDSAYVTLALDWMKLWAAHPKQTTERIKKTIGEFQSFELKPASLTVEIVRNWRVERRILHRALRSSRLGLLPNRTVSELWWVHWLLPWELLRLERLQDAIFAADLQEAEFIERDLQKQGFVTTTAERVAPWDRDLAVPWKYLQTTLAPPEFVGMPYWTPAVEVNRLATERMDLIAMAVADFKRVNHKIPGSLRELVPAYFSQLPVDPWSGGDFMYEPQGLSKEIGFEQGRLDADVPFLASVGMFDSRFVRRPSADKAHPAFEIVSRFASTEERRRRAAAFIFPGPVARLP